MWFRLGESRRRLPFLRPAEKCRVADRMRRHRAIQEFASTRRAFSELLPAAGQICLRLPVNPPRDLQPSQKCDDVPASRQQLRTARRPPSTLRVRHFLPVPAQTSRTFSKFSCRRNSAVAARFKNEAARTSFRVDAGAQGARAVRGRGDDGFAAHFFRREFARRIAEIKINSVGGNADAIALASRAKQLLASDF